MKINAYLMYKGQCEAAFTFYAKCLGGKIVHKITHGESPAAGETPKERLGEILHARFEVDGNVLMGSDCPWDHFDEAKGTQISINIDDPQEAERIFAAMSEGGHLTMPIQETFWAQRFGMLIDPFGIPWMINCGTKS